MPKLEMFRNQTGTESFSAHDTIFEKGDPRTVMYVVQEGEAEIRLGGKVLEVVGPGWRLWGNGDGGWSVAHRHGRCPHRLQIGAVRPEAFSIFGSTNALLRHRSHAGFGGTIAPGRSIDRSLSPVPGLVPAKNSSSDLRNISELIADVTAHRLNAQHSGYPPKKIRKIE